MHLQTEPTKIGNATVLLRDDGSFDRATLEMPKPFRLFLTIDLPDLVAIYRVCEHVFGHWDEPRNYPPPRQLWEGSSFRYFAPFFGDLNTFWISSGPINNYIPTLVMKEAFTDLKAVIEKVGGIENLTS